MAPGNNKANRRTPFDDNLIADPDAPRDTQPLPRKSGARTVRPSRLLPPRASGAYAPPHGPAAPHGPTGAHGPAAPNYADDNDTGALSGPLQPAMARRVPLSAIIGLSMVGGALAVVFISTMVSRALPRPDLKGDHVITAPTPDVLMEKPADTAADGGVATPPAAHAAAPTAPTARSATADATKTQDTQDNHPGDAAPVPDAPASTTPQRSTDDTGVKDGTAGDSTAATAGDATSTADGTHDATAKPVAAARKDEDQTEPFVQRSGGYAITPPPQFKLVRRGRRTIWSGPDGMHLLVETTPRPSRSPFGDWLILDARFRKAYGSRYRSNGIKQTTLAGRPAAIWDFELDTKTGTLRKLDVAVHANGHGYAVLGSAPVDYFDDVRPRLEAAINSFQLEAARHPRRDTADQPRARSEDSDSVQNNDKPVANNRVQDDLRPDMGY